ncbi:MAG TPA: M17 family peptidase N-terminal domain-containing protein, partial [Pseudomonadales bacterium]|nr:M17 family peptidase N-terminal domain-containing protein [Pseudomonadales bacterium]
MEFAIRIGSPEKQRVGCLIVAVHERGELSAAAQLLDDASKGALRTVLERSDIEGKVGQTLLLHSLPGVLAARVLLVGAGPNNGELNDKQFIKVAEKAVAALKTTKTETAASYLTDLVVKN